MKITLVQKEIEEALTNYVASQGIDISDKMIEVNLTAGRGANGITADLDIFPVTVETSRKATKVAPIKATPVEDEDDDSVDEDVVDEAQDEPVAEGNKKSLFG